MADIVSPGVRSRMMSRIRGRDTRPEIAIRKALHARGLRYRLNVRELPGSPDLVFPRHRAVVFVHGCFWHRHSGCPYAATPATNAAFWERKFRDNVERDRANVRRLRALGWRVAIVWECAVGRVPTRELVDRLERFVRSEEPDLEIPEPSGTRTRGLLAR